jgi:hypothetical protein
MVSGYGLLVKSEELRMNSGVIVQRGKFKGFAFGIGEP